MFTTSWLHPSPETRLEVYHSELLDKIIAMISDSKLPWSTLADMARVSPQTIGKWMSREVHTPRIDTVAKVAKALGYRLDLIPDRVH